MVMLSSDCKSRMGCLVHDFVELPHTSMKHDDDSTVAVESQGPNKGMNDLLQEHGSN